MRPVLLIDAVGLAARHIGERTPNLAALARRGFSAPMSGALPGVTLTSQATMLTGTQPSQHGAVGNGWYWPDLGEVRFWQQANSLVQAEPLYVTAKRQHPEFTCAKIFWWFNMGADVEWSITPRPFYPADGRKVPAAYGWPREFPEGLERELGAFPFFDFWGPKSGLPSSRWLANAAMHTLRTKRPTLTMVYLPHLDYSHQRFGPDSEQGLAALTELDALIGELIAAADECGAETVVVSEYAIERVTNPVHINRALRTAGLLEVRETPDGEILDCFASRAFAASDHQVAHVYTKNAEARAVAARVLGELDGVDELLDEGGKRDHGLNHERAGDLIAVAEPDAWFTYYYWLDDARAPDFAPTVDIHRKPGYDPAEMFVDPKFKLPMARVARRLAQKKLGFRYLMDLIPIHADMVRGSHGRLPSMPERGPVIVSSVAAGAPGHDVFPMTEVKAFVLQRCLALGPTEVHS